MLWLGGLHGEGGLALGSSDESHVSIGSQSPDLRRQRGRDRLLGGSLGGGFELPDRLRMLRSAYRANNSAT
jgi:hypothetical protein